MSTPEHAERCRALAREFRAHDLGTSAFANSVASASGLASPPGRAVVRILNWPLATYLDDAADNIEDGNWRRPNDPSPAAAAMVAQQHHRHKGRRLAPMAPESRDAALAYLRERIELIAQARDLFCVVHRRRSSTLQRRLHMLAQHEKYLAKVSAFLSSAADPLEAPSAPAIARRNLDKRTDGGAFSPTPGGSTAPETAPPLPSRNYFGRGRAAGRARCHPVGKRARRMTLHVHAFSRGLLSLQRVQTRDLLRCGWSFCSSCWRCISPPRSLRTRGGITSLRRSLY